jgi:hypothetical protein
VNIRQRVRRWSRKAGIDIVPYPPRDVGHEFRSLYDDVAPFTMTSAERVYALHEATRYVSRHRMPGAIVECGVWRGGSMMTVAKTLIALADVERELFLFDTFEGMVHPGVHDRRHDDVHASDLLGREDRRHGASTWAVAGLAEVQRALSTTGYPQDRLHFVPGKVEETIPDAAPDQIALLRLDTDWYESTRHELIHLFPRIVAGGVLVIDDYGYWKGARKAVDEYLAEHDVPILLSRIDETGRVAVVPAR